MLYEPPLIILNTDDSITLNLKTASKKNPDKKLVFSFRAKPILESEDVSIYAEGISNFCSENINEYSYISSDGDKIFDTIVRKKAYGVVDYLNQDKGGVVVTILQRCHNNCIDVSIPIVFLYCNLETCKQKHMLNANNNIRKRKILSISAKYSSRENTENPLDETSYTQRHK
jgi:hypothetical protein